MESQLDLLKKKIENDKRENIKGKEGLQDIILARDIAEMKYTLLERNVKRFTRESKLESNKIVTATKEAMNRLVSTYEREELKHEHEKREMISEQNQVKCSTRGIESELKSVISQRDSLGKLLAEKTSALLTINRQLEEQDTINIEYTQRLSELESNLTTTKQQRTYAIEGKRNIECIIERDRTSLGPTFADRDGNLLFTADDDYDSDDDESFHPDDNDDDDSLHSSDNDDALDDDAPDDGDDDNPPDNKAAGMVDPGVINGTNEGDDNEDEYQDGSENESGEDGENFSEGASANESVSDSHVY
jgi:hypothetical protein